VLSTASPSIVVTTAAELVAALSSDTGDLTVVVQPGIYQLNHAIEVPDHIRLVGGGTMVFDDSDLPTGFVPESRTVIAALAGVTGDFVTLGNGASLQGLVIQDVARPGLTGGGVVVVSSRWPGDSVSAQIAECEIINPNPAGSAPAGPSGRGLVAITRNPHFTPDGGAPHEQSAVSVHLTHSIIRSPANGSGVFGINFAGGSHVDLQLQHNVIGGQFNVTGGASRPDSVVGSTLVLQSIGNLYRADGPTPTGGWNLQGGADAPAGGTPDETSNNRLWVHSVEDRIEGFSTTIFAAGGRRNSAVSAAVSSNEVDLILQGTRLLSMTTDMQLRGASSGVAGMAPGDGNELRLTMRHVIGSGPRTNDYANSAALGVPALGVGNRLLIAGSLMAFSRTNEAISPMPDGQFFTAER
jgi:hypothetical protein